MVQIDLIRHAITRWNLEKRLQGRHDTHLSKKGRSDAGKWADRLGRIHYDAIFSSPMIRARQTADILSEKLKIPVQIEPDLHEQDFGQWEGQRLSQLRRAHPGQLEAEESKGWAFCPPDGESRKAVLERLLEVLEKICKQYCSGHLLMVTHSSAIKVLVYHLLGRQFLPGEKPGYQNVIKPYHVHRIVWQDQLMIDQLNVLNLNE
jgi:broad specificity phosphatase PhoE